MKKTWSYGLFIILVGILIILVALYIEEVKKPSLESAIVTLRLLTHIGIAFISIGLIGIIVDFRDWQEYFQKQIANTIIQRHYLNSLNQPQLIDLQIDTLKAYFKLEDIDREGRFLEFFQGKIRRYIAEPYREDTTGVVAINYLDEQSFIVEETFTYKCRKVGDYIQDAVRWGYENANEIDRIESFKITVRVPQNFFQSPDFKAKYPFISSQEKEYDKDNSDKDLQAWDKGIGYTLSLMQYKEIDGLFIKVQVRFVIPIYRMLSWYMAHPTKNLKATIKYPPDRKIQVITFGLDQNELDEVDSPELYTLTYGSWVLPINGLAFSVSEIRKKDSEGGVRETVGGGVPAGGGVVADEPSKGNAAVQLRVR